MMGNAVSLALLTAVGGFIVYQKLPPKARHLITKYSLLTDIFAMIGVYVLFGGTVTALIAGGIVSVIVSALLHIANHPDDFVWLTDLLQRVKDLLLQLQEKMQELNQNYKEKKGYQSPVQEVTGGSAEPSSVNVAGSSANGFVGADRINVAA